MIDIIKILVSRVLTRTMILRTVNLMMITVLFITCKSPKKAKPNILYIFTDDQSIRSVSCYPESLGWVSTPNIDQLAKEGVRFTDAYIGSWCMPSRATALTGKLQHGIQSMRMVGNYPGCTYNPDECPFWPEVFRMNGYYTGMIGKWHTGDDHGHGRVWDYSAVWDHTQREIYGGYFTDQKISFNGGTPEAVGGYSTDNYTEWAVTFLQDRAKDQSKPWYLWMCYDAVHEPYTPAERHLANYKNVPSVTVPKDIFPPRSTKPTYMKNYGVWEKDNEGNPVSYDAVLYPSLEGGRGNEGKLVSLDEAVKKYNRSVLALDEGVGKIIKTLKETGQLDNTLIVFASDQGFAWGQHGFAWKYAPYDANLRAPLIFRFPGKVAINKICKHPVGGQDIIPTFFSMADILLPWEMHGHDITPLLKNPDSEWEYPVLMENTKWYYGKDTERDDRPGSMGVPWWIFLRKGKYKYIRTLVDDEIEELYDLEADPDELVNLAFNPDYWDILISFREQLLEELKRTNAGMVNNLPKVRDLSLYNSNKSINVIK